MNIGSSQWPASTNRADALHTTTVYLRSLNCKTTVFHDHNASKIASKTASSPIIRAFLRITAEEIDIIVRQPPAPSSALSAALSIHFHASALREREAFGTY